MSPFPVQKLKEVLRDGRYSFTVSSCRPHFGRFDFHIWYLSANDESLAVWLAVESAPGSIRADDPGSLCDPWRLSLDRFEQSSSTPKSDLVYGLLQHRARGHHDCASSKHAFRAWSLVWRYTGSINSRRLARISDAPRCGGGPSPRIEQLRRRQVPTGASLKEIGRGFDNTTLHSSQKIEEMRRSDGSLDSAIGQLMNGIARRSGRWYPQPSLYSKDDRHPEVGVSDRLSGQHAHGRHRRHMQSGHLTAMSFDHLPPVVGPNEWSF